jgi:hypothetical protein
MAASLKQILESQLDNSVLVNHEVNALKVILFTAFLPSAIDLYSAVLKDVCPNMKKKKSAEFDTLK